MATAKDFFLKVKEYIDKARETQRENIQETAKIMQECMEKDGVVQLFGLDHGREFSMELGYRAGGLMPFHQFNVEDLALRKVISEEELRHPEFNNQVKRAHQLWELYRIDPTDMFILISNTGCEGILVEMAQKAKEQGHKVIAVVSKAMSAKAHSNHPSGKKISDFAEVVIDNCADEKDAVLTLDEEHRGGQVATIIGNVIAQMITAETYKLFKEKGQDCPILLSANIAGADIHNRKLSDQYLGRWNS